MCPGENPKILAAVCACGGQSLAAADQETLTRALKRDPAIDRVVFIDHGCTAAGWEQLVEIATEHHPNRILIGACHPYLYINKLRELGRRISLDPVLMDVVDILSPAMTGGSGDPAQDGVAQSLSALDRQLTALNMAAARLRHMEPQPAPEVSVTGRALVVGGGIAGMHAALAVADHGYPVDIVEIGEQLGGNLHWLHRTVEGTSIRPLLEETVQKVEKHPQIHVHLNTRISGSFGEVGNFMTAVENGDGTVENIRHGAVVLATGGDEAKTESYGFGRSDAIITQKELESRLHRDDWDPGQVGSVVMIQCVDSREAPRNFCSRVCLHIFPQTCPGPEGGQPGNGRFLFSTGI